MDLSEVVLHPVRMRILRCFLGDRHLTTAALGRLLGDVPTASLYRHVALLADNGVLAVAAERRVRGTVERTYSLAGGVIGAQDASSLTVQQLRGAFLSFVAGLVDDLERHLATGTDEPAHGVGFREVGLHLSDDEVVELGEAMAAAIQPFADRGPTAGRRLRVLASVLLPRTAAEVSSDEADG
jgi:hypothetical protein